MKETDFRTLLTTALAGGMNAAGIGASPEEFRLAGKAADVSWPGAIRRGLDAAALVETLHRDREKLFRLGGVCVVREVTSENGWLLFGLTSEVLGQETGKIVARPQPHPGDGEDRLFLHMLARHPICSVPDDPIIKRITLKLILAKETRSEKEYAAAVRALQAALDALPPGERPQMAAQLGGIARLALTIPNKEQ
ncbi:MAG: hypothetical protein Q4C53_08370 [Clostridia bacterium]|nr:hypothetical protein [Clostridia bacterium]